MGKDAFGKSPQDARGEPPPPNLPSRTKKTRVLYEIKCGKIQRQTYQSIQSTFFMGKPSTLLAVSTCVTRWAYAVIMEG